MKVKDERRSGRFLRLPYDYRHPYLGKMVRVFWNFKYRRIFVSKVYGWCYGSQRGYEIARILRRLIR